MTIHIDIGGPTYFINVRGNRRPFELHPWCGPHPHDPLEHIPAGFWDAIERWQLGGKRIEGEDAVVPQWCSACNGEGDKIKHLGGRHYQTVGPCKACGGAKVRFNASATG